METDNATQPSPPTVEAVVRPILHQTVRELNAYAALSWNPLTALKQTVSFPLSKK